MARAARQKLSVKEFKEDILRGGRTTAQELLSRDAVGCMDVACEFLVE